MCHNSTFFNKNPECKYNFKQIETSISTYNINNGKMNGLSGRINRVKLYSIMEPYVYDVTTSMLVSLNNEKSAGVELFCNAKTPFV